MKKELLWIADTGNNRVLKIEMPVPDPLDIWNDMKQELIDGNIEEALTHFTEASQDRYRRIFNLLGDKTSAIAGNMREAELIYMKEDIAKYRIRRSYKGEDITYYIYFVRNRNGEWEIKSF